MVCLLLGSGLVASFPHRTCLAFLYVEVIDDGRVVVFAVASPVVAALRNGHVAGGTDKHPRILVVVEDRIPLRAVADDRIKRGAELYVLVLVLVLVPYHVEVGLSGVCRVTDYRLDFHPVLLGLVNELRQGFPVIGLAGGGDSCRDDALYGHGHVCLEPEERTGLALVADTGVGVLGGDLAHPDVGDDLLHHVQALCDCRVGRQHVVGFNGLYKGLCRCQHRLKLLFLRYLRQHEVLVCRMHSLCSQPQLIRKIVHSIDRGGS